MPDIQPALAFGTGIDTIKAMKSYLSCPREPCGGHGWEDRLALYQALGSVV